MKHKIFFLLQVSNSIDGELEHAADANASWPPHGEPSAGRGERCPNYAFNFLEKNFAIFFNLFTNLKFAPQKSFTG